MFPSDRFAAFLAHALNSAETPVCAVEPGHLYVVLLDALAAKYAETLLYHSTYRFRMSEEEAAGKYFKTTLERALWLSNKVDMSVAHRLLAALCQRGVGAAWQVAELRREEEQPARVDSGIAPLLAVGSFEAVAGRLGELSTQISSGNPAATIRERKGAVWLVVGLLRARVPEEMSAWDAVRCGPTLVRSLPAGEPFNRFCGIVIDAVRTANRPFQELLGLGRGICPFDWVDVLSTNQVRSLRRFLETVALAGEPDSLDLWSRAWTKAPVPGFRSAAELWASEIGNALRNRSGNPVEVGIDDLEDDEDSRPDFLEEHEFRQRLALLEKHEIICAAERGILERLYRGETLSELAAEAAVQDVLAKRRMKFPQFVADLQRRIDNWRIPGEKLP